jgi:hypothetical protein
MTIEINSIVKVIGNDVDWLIQGFRSDFESEDEIKAQEAYIGMVGLVEDTLTADGLDDAVVVGFTDGNSIIVAPHNLQVVEEEMTWVEDLPQAAPPPAYEKLNANECELLDKLVVSLAPAMKDNTNDFIVQQAVELVLAVSKAKKLAYLRG